MYDFQTCLNLFRIIIWYKFLPFMWFSNMTKLVQKQYDKVQIFWEGTKFCEISIYFCPIRFRSEFKVNILQNFVAFSEYMNFKRLQCPQFSLFSVAHAIPAREIPNLKKNQHNLLDTYLYLNKTSLVVKFKAHLHSQDWKYALNFRNWI